MRYKITVHGRPKTKGSLKCVGRGGRHRLVEDAANRPWRDHVATAAKAILDQAGGPFAGPVGVRLRFTLDKPKSDPRRRWPIKRSTGDIDKLERLVLDAITDAGLWHDDSQCVLLVTAKVYTGEPTAGPYEGLTLQVWALEEMPDVLV